MLDGHLALRNPLGPMRVLASHIGTAYQNAIAPVRGTFGEFSGQRKMIPLTLWTSCWG